LKTPISVIGELKERSFPDVDEAETRAKAQECRAEVRAAGRVAQIAAVQEEIARAGNWPTVSLFANYFGTSPEFFLAQERDLRWNWIAGVNLSFTLFSGFETRGRIAKARGERGAARARLQDIEDQVGLEVREALLRLSEADALVRSQRENVRQAERALKIARLRYEQGAATQLEVTDSRVALTQAQVNRLSALYRYEIALAELERHAGCPPSGRKE
ncbi:MAG: TolC family protein, partial [Candidatus Manganitrophaceae bacterium]